MDSKVTDLKGLFLEQLRDRYNAALQQAKAYPVLHQAVSDTALATLIADDIEANTAHVRNLEKVFAQMGESPEGEICEGTQGLIHEASELLTYVKPSKVLNLAIAVSIQHVNHHDIAGYRSCQIFANAIGETQVAQTLGSMLEDEKATDKGLETMMQVLLQEHEY